MHELLDHQFSALKKMVFLAAAFAMIFSSPSYAVNGKVILYPAPAGEANTEEYSVSVNGQPVDVYMAYTQHHDKKYYFASFDFSGKVDISVSSRSPLRTVKILPESCGIKPDLIAENSLKFTAGRAFKISVEPDCEESPLLIFGNDPETDIPVAGDPNLIYFGPGIHNPGKILLKSNQTLYLAGGAVVKGGVEAAGENIKILGRGILDGSDYPHQRGPTIFMVHFEKCRNIIIRDIILRGSWSYTIAPCGSDQDISVRNTDVLHFVDNRPPEDFWANCVFYIQPSDNMPMSRIRFENIRINASDGNNLLIKMMPMICKGMESLEIKRKTGNFATWDYQDPGRYIKDCYFKNIMLYGKPGNGRGLIYIAGADSLHPVENIKLKNVIRFGMKTFINSPDVIIGPYTDKIKFY